MRGAAVGSAELHDTRFVAQSVFDAGAQAEFGIGDKAGTLHVIAVRGLKGAASADDDDFGRDARNPEAATARSEEHTSELQSLMRIPYAVFCLKKKNKTKPALTHTYHHSHPLNVTSLS